MPIQPTYPGVYIEELPSGVRTIVGVSTSVTGFIGRAKRGPVNTVTTIFSYPDYERIFGGLWEESAMSYAVQQYFMNGGAQAEIVRAVNAGAEATLTLSGAGGDLVLQAANPGAWGNHLLARADHDTKNTSDTSLFNLKIKDSQTGALEVHLNVSTDSANTRFIETILANESDLVVVSSGASNRPNVTPAPDAGATEFADGVDIGLGVPSSNAIAATPPVGNPDGSALTDTEISGSGASVPKTGLHAFDDADIINLLCVPPYDSLQGNVSGTIRTQALNYAKKRRAIFLVDPDSSWTTFSDPDLSSFDLDENAAIYFPRIKSPDPLQEGRLTEFVPCGAMAGLIARNDAQRGVWKAPAGIETNLVGVPELSVNLTDQENGTLNPQGINCLRSFKGVGRVAWGARTLRGADNLADQWKYLPVRRLALFIEESLYRGSQWIVFEPNDEPLWAQIRLNFGAFMHNLFRQGAFQGTKAKDAYLVKCDSETTTQNDINQGIVNIVVGFAPLKPAEFVIIKIQQLAGQVAA